MVWGNRIRSNCKASLALPCIDDFYMSKLKILREQKNLTQEELSEKSGISVRTIQRIESGTEPKGHTLKMLSKALEVNIDELRERETETINSHEPDFNLSKIKLINLSSILFVVFPPANILVPLILTYIFKQRNSLTKEIISVQILWTIISFILFMLSSFAKNWLELSNRFTLLVMVILVLSNVFIILRNAAEIDKKEKLFFRLNYSLL